MLFVWLAIVLPPTLVFAYVALSGLFLLLRSGLQNPQSRLGPLLVVLIIVSGYLLSFHQASRFIWKDMVGPFVSQILHQLGTIVLGAGPSTAPVLSPTTVLSEQKNDWLGPSTAVLLPIIEKEAHLSHLVALFLGLFMSSYVTTMTDSLKKRQIPQYMYSFADTSFRIVLSLEFYLGTVLWFRFCLAPVLAHLGLTASRESNIAWMGTLVLGFSHTTAFAFGNFLYQDYYRRGFDKKPEYAFIKYYSIYGSIFVAGRMASQVLCQIKTCTRDGEALLMLAIYFLAFLHVTIENETFHNVIWPLMTVGSFAVFFLDAYLKPIFASMASALMVPLTTTPPLLLVIFSSILGASAVRFMQASPRPEMAPVFEQIHDQKRRANQFPPPFPNGWYKLARSAELKPGQVINVNGLGRSFAVFRGEVDEEIHVLDALCPHLGANMAIGGVVEGDAVKCPFHGWKFDGKGHCIDIPYAKSIPSLARTKRWTHREYAGIIVIWYDAEEREPMYEPVPFPLAEGTFRRIGHRRGTLPMHIQDFAENASDWMHFSLLHDRLSIPILDRFFYIKHKTKCDYDPETNPFNFVFNDYPTVHSIFSDEPIQSAEAVARVEFTGPGGLVYFRFFTPAGQVVVIKSFLPVGEKGLQLTMEDEAFAEKSVPWLAAKHIIREANKAFDDDIFVWRHKTYKHKPVFVKEDAPVKQFRDYYKKFYSPNSRTYAHDQLDWDPQESRRSTVRTTIPASSHSHSQGSPSSMQNQPRRQPPPQQRMNVPPPPGHGPPPPQGQYMRQGPPPPRPMGPGPGMYPPNMQQGMSNYPPPNMPPNMRPRPPSNMMPMGSQMNMNGQRHQMSGPIPPMGGQMRPMGMGGPPPMGRHGTVNMGPPMGPPRPNHVISGFRAPPPPGQGPGMGPGSGSSGSSAHSAPLSIYGGIGTPTNGPGSTPAYPPVPAPMAPVNYQPKTSHGASPVSRTITSSPSPIPGSGPSPSGPPAPIPPKALRRENSSPRKDSTSSTGRKETPSPQVRNEQPSLPSPVIRKEVPGPPPPQPSSTSTPIPRPPMRRDTSSSLKSQKDAPLPSPTLKKEVPVPQRKETPPQPMNQQPLRKNLISVSSPSMSSPLVSGRPPVVEVAQFGREGFNHEDYLTQNLANASEETIRAFLQSLKDSKSMAAGDLQDNVFKNYNEFVTISKEISKLESDMQTLRGLLDDLKTASDNLQDDDDEFLLTAGIEDSAPVVPKRMTVMVSSMSDLTSVWKAQMMALWEGIEGAQKMLPYHSKRHLIRESPSFVEVNMSTNKIKHPVHIVLMNDTLLVATRKKKTAAHSKFKLLGDRCWPLTEITIEDMKDTADIRNAIKITHGTEVFVYKTEKGQEKQTMLVNAKRSTEEMLARTNESRNKGGMFGFAPAMPNRAGMPFRTSVGSNQTDTRWLAEFTDELDVLIAQHDFDGAVTGIEKATVMLSQMTTLPATKKEETRKRLDERVSRLSRAILMNLGQAHITKLAVQRDVGWLERLGCLDQARDVFLGNRTKVIRSRTSQVKPKRDPAVHVEELAMIVFTSIKNTSEWYELSFKDPKMSSALVKWAKQEIEAFADLYKDIVFGNSQQGMNFQVIADCFKITQDQCNKLRDAGLDMVFVLETVLLPYLTETIAEHERRCLERMDAIIEHDDFAPMSGEDLGSPTPLSASMVAFYTVMLQFVNNICLIGSLTLYSRIVDSIAILFKAYLNRTIQVYEERGMTDEQRAVANSNFQFISESFISRVIVQLRHQFDRPIPELDVVREELGGVELS